MKLKAEREFDVYEAFDPYGFGDGDDALKWEAINEVYCLLRGMDYDYETASTIHNDGYIYLVIAPDGRKLDIEECGKTPKEAIAEAFPELAKALDELNEKELWV
jgi:hypothetical protein